MYLRSNWFSNFKTSLIETIMDTNIVRQVLDIHLGFRLNINRGNSDRMYE
jgi:hypothetical protein